MSNDQDETVICKDDYSKSQLLKKRSQLIFGTVTSVSLLFLFEIGEPPLSFARSISLYCFVTSLFIGALLFMITTRTASVREETTHSFEFKDACKKWFEKIIWKTGRTIFSYAFALFLLGIISWLWDINPIASILGGILSLIVVFYYSFILRLTNRFGEEYHQSQDTPVNKDSND